MTSHDESLSILSSSSKFTKQVIYHIRLGFLCALRGFIFSWNHTCKHFSNRKKIRMNFFFIQICLDIWEAQQRSLLSLLACTLLIYIILYFFFLPFRFTIWLISFAYAFAPSTVEWFERASSARELLFKLISFIPLIGVFIMNNLLGTCV
jgi:hypothetical protein